VDTLIAPVIGSLREHHPKSKTDEVERAFSVAEIAHAGQMRMSGDKYITHPVAVAQILAELGLELNPDKTRVVDLREGREGFDFLGCHFHARVSGRMLERSIRRYYLQRWPSARSMKRFREKVRKLTDRSRTGVKDVRVLIRDLNLVLTGWGNYFRTGNAASKFGSADSYVVQRLRDFMRKRYGRNLHAGVATRWTREWFEQQGLRRLRGTIRYPRAA